MRNLHIIMPMAGEGSRFSKEGYDIPKPLLRLNNNIPFFEQSVSSLCNLYNILQGHLKITFIVRQEHIDKYYIDDIIKHRLQGIFSELNILSVQKTTRGAVETCLLATPYIDIVNDSILIMDCDLCYQSNTYEYCLLSALRGNSENDGLLLSFKSSKPRYSYAQIDDNDNVVKTAEKMPISDHALIGSYFFTYADDFFYAAHKLIEENAISDIREYYVSLLYNYLIKEHKCIKCIDATEYSSFGTPEELKAYEDKSNNN